MKKLDRSHAVRAFTAAEGARIGVGAMIPGRSAALIVHLAGGSTPEFGRASGARTAVVVALTPSGGLAAEGAIAAGSGALRGVSVSPCGQRFAVRGAIGQPTALRWLDGRDAGLTLEDEGVFALASATGAVVGRDSATELESVDVATGRRTPLEARHGAVFEHVAASPDGAWVIAVALRSKVLQVWQRSDGARARQLSVARVLALGAPAPAFSPDGALVACGTSVDEGPAVRYGVALFEVGGRWPARPALDLGAGHIQQLVFSRTGRRILTAQCAQGRADLKVWERDTATLRHHLELTASPAEWPGVGFLGTSDDDRITYVALAGERAIWSFETP